MSKIAQKLDEKSIPPVTSNASPNYSLSEILTRETVILGCITAFLYYYSYQTDRAYLQYFYISDEFVSFSIERIAKSVTIVLIFGISLYQVVDLILKLNWKKSVVAVCLISMFPIVFLIPAIISYRSYGWNISTWFWSGATVIMILLGFVVPLFGRKRHGSYIEAVYADLDSEVVIHDRGILGRLQGKIGNGLVLVFFILVFIVPPLCSYSGYLAASTNRTFTLFKKEGDWLLIRRDGDTLLFTGYNAHSNTLTKQSLAVQFASEPNIKFESLRLKDPPLHPDGVQLF
jgi:hypothetical protein